MSRGESYGGGQSSLGYLFSSDDQPNLKTPPPTKPTGSLPPYGVDTAPEKAADPISSDKHKNSGNYPRPQGQISGNFITVSSYICVFIYLYGNIYNISFIYNFL